MKLFIEASAYVPGLREHTVLRVVLAVCLLASMVLAAGAGSQWD